MAHPGDNPLHHLEEQMERRDLHVARGPGTGRPRRSREVRRRPAWALPALSLAMLITGMVLPHGLLLAAGLVTAGTAAILFTPARDRTEPRPRPP
ncbi:hypothetical protein OG930_41050 [Streptomyces sp. NBC_01799]|uniref:hypothetical protein n=1 Tax=Streptomyces sp. NBC_01800 TaxID=2975945 RepID=UPI002DDBBF74|nr:hypothetical protein [Streptomyces sp. NBC_01800]WSA72866.1 hypothetical protein OIE65_41660 [Streptomyces sp. NBC_01800]WSA81393.1 hypothetical protein OG930_41050 [Streptomyces sp. NBC_01799]